jgi:transposase
LAPFRGQIVRLLETHPYTATQIFQRLREAGFKGGFSILKEYVRKVRPPRTEAFLTLSFAPGERAQVDWGQYGTITVGNTTRRLSFFVMVLCYSRKLYVEFTLAETMEHFLACHEHAFEYFGGICAGVMVDNLKSAVLQHAVGEQPVLNPRYKEFADHYGFKIIPCGVAQPQSKGRVENAVGYIKKNFLAGSQLTDFKLFNPAAREWLDTVANVRLHGATKQKPLELFEKEKPCLKPLPLRSYDLGLIRATQANSRFRVAFDSNTYSVPAEYAGKRLVLKVHPEHLCIYHEDKLIARHTRSYERNRDFEQEDHPRPLLEERRQAQAQKLLARLLTLSSKAEAFFRGLEERRLNAASHVRKVVALSEIYGREKTARAIEDAVDFQAFSSEYIALILEQRQRVLPDPGALCLLRSTDLLELELPQPDLTPYRVPDEKQPQPQQEKNHEPFKG